MRSNKTQDKQLSLKQKYNFKNAIHLKTNAIKTKLKFQFFRKPYKTIKRRIKTEKVKDKKLKHLQIRLMINLLNI